MHSHKLSEWLCLSAAHAGWPMHLLLDQQTPTAATVHLSTLPMGFAIFAFLQSAATQYANWTCLLDAPPLTNRCHAAQKHVTAAQSFTGCCNSRFCLCGQRRTCHPLWCQFTLLTQLPNTAPVPHTWAVCKLDRQGWFCRLFLVADMVDGSMWLIKLLLTVDNRKFDPLAGPQP